MTLVFNSKTIWVAAIAAALTLFVTSGGVNAHRVKSCLTTIDWKVDSRTLHVTHKIHYHDAAEVLRSLMPKGSTETLMDLGGIARMALYVDQDFEIKTSAGKKQPLTPIGGEVEGNYLYLYFESTTSVQSKTITVRSDVFRKFYTGQINRLVLRHANHEFGATLKGKGQIKTFEL